MQYKLKRNNHPQESKSLWLEIRPLIAFHDYHSTTHVNGAIGSVVEEHFGSASVTPYQGLPSSTWPTMLFELRKTGDWYRNVEYDVEREHGLDFGDLFNPLVLLSTCGISTCRFAARLW